MGLEGGALRACLGTRVAARLDWRVSLGGARNRNCGDCTELFDGPEAVIAGLGSAVVSRNFFGACGVR